MYIISPLGFSLPPYLSFSFSLFSLFFNISSLSLAVLLENFSIFYNDDDTNLSLSVIKDFKQKWRHFDTHAKVYIQYIVLIKGNIVIL